MRSGFCVLASVMGLAAAVVATMTIPVALCGRGASKWMAGDLGAQLMLARGVARVALDADLSRSRFRTGSAQFDGEWLFGTYLMAGIGFAQLAIEHPEVREQQALLAKRCIAELLTPEVRAFDKETWGEDPIDGLGSGKHHAAYRGYLNLLLGLYRLASADATYNELNDRITASLIQHVSASSIVLIQSYPEEVYPVDNCFVIGSIALHQRVTGKDHGATIARWSKQARARYVDAGTRLMVQAVDPSDGTPLDRPRGSGTALGLFALHYADRQLAEDLYQGIKTTLARTWLGFGAVREYPEWCQGPGDIDSGPIFFGYGMSATGFTIASARRYGDAAYFRRLFASAHLCGAPVRRQGRVEYVSGGPLGNAILFAMLTAPDEAADSTESGR